MIAAHYETQTQSSTRGLIGGSHISCCTQSTNQATHTSKPDSIHNFCHLGNVMSQKNRINRRKRRVQSSPVLEVASSAYGTDVDDCLQINNDNLTYFRHQTMASTSGCFADCSATALSPVIDECAPCPTMCKVQTYRKKSEASAAWTP